MKWYLALLVFFLPIFLLGNKSKRYLLQIQNKHLLLELGCDYLFDKEVEKAKESFQDAIDLFTQQRDTALLAIANMAYAICCTKDKEGNKAIPHLLNAYNLAKHSGDTLTYYCSIDALYAIYNVVGKYQLALNYKRELITLPKLKQRTKIYEKNLRELAFLYLKMSLFDSAKIYLDQALALSTEDQDQDRIASNHGGLSVYYRALNDYDKALYYRMEQLKYLESRGDLTRALAGAKLQAAKIFILTKNWDKAKKYAVSTLEISDQLGLMILEEEALAVLTKIEMALNKNNGHSSSMNEPEDDGFSEDPIVDHYQIQFK